MAYPLLVLHKYQLTRQIEEPRCSVSARLKKGSEGDSNMEEQEDRERVFQSNLEETAKLQCARLAPRC